MPTPIVEMLDFNGVVIPLKLKILYCNITYEIDKEGKADECDLELYFTCKEDCDSFLKLFQAQLKFDSPHMSIRYGYNSPPNPLWGSATSVAQFQVRGIQVRGDDKTARYVTLKGYSPMLEANDITCILFPPIEGEPPLTAAELVLQICMKYGWAHHDQKGNATVYASNDKPDRNYVVEQLGDLLETRAQFIQRLANIVGFDFFMKYNTITRQPIVYFKPRNQLTDSPDFTYYYEPPKDATDVGNHNLIENYEMDISTAKNAGVREAATNLELTEPVEWTVDQIPESWRGADDGGAMPPKDSSKEVSTSARTVPDIIAFIEAGFLMEQENTCLIRFNVIGNPFMYQGQIVWLRGTDELSEGKWSITKVVHNFEFNPSYYECQVTLTKNTFPVSQEAFEINGTAKLQEFPLSDIEGVK